MNANLLLWIGQILVADGRFVVARSEPKHAAGPRPLQIPPTCPAMTSA